MCAKKDTGAGKKAKKLSKNDEEARKRLLTEMDELKETYQKQEKIIKELTEKTRTFRALLETPQPALREEKRIEPKASRSSMTRMGLIITLIGAVIGLLGVCLYAYWRPNPVTWIYENSVYVLLMISTGLALLFIGFGFSAKGRIKSN